MLSQVSKGDYRRFLTPINFKQRTWLATVTSILSDHCPRLWVTCRVHLAFHDDYVIMGTMASQITSLTIVYSTVYSGTDQRKKSKLRVTGLRDGNSQVTGEFPRKWPVTRKMFPFDDVIMLIVYHPCATVELLASCCLAIVCVTIVAKMCVCACTSDTKIRIFTV